MKLWMRKVTVVLVTIMTLGIYVPPIHLNTDAEDNKEAVSPKEDVNEDFLTTTLDISREETDSEPENDEEELDYVNTITEKAKEQTITKLGPRIVSQVDDDFTTEILPNIEEVVTMILAGADEEDLSYYGITESPADGFGERIFNIYDLRTNEDLARFHVRRDNRPQEGYWFNFHYHLNNDDFEEHHEIGEIYWDKNIPPKWMA
ncbi:YpjP family protein [Virgibacillus ndiopensis]|uniref:YpjP family protein n=1 Tax=Virgibacillus ndiopensis TaxID=2004408 RepID=UPI000C08912E|nr:YpjP family protein [Virgibacillus ndiopensis]